MPVDPMDGESMNLRSHDNSSSASSTSAQHIAAARSGSHSAVRTSMHWVAAFSLLTVVTGCARTMLEHTVVEQFVDAISEENEPALRRIASTDFESRAMRSEDALTDLEVIDLPKDELSIVEVEETSENERKVIAKEESGGKYQFVLVKDPVKDRWVVDDVLIRQRSKGTRVTQSTSEVMDLIHTLREFLGIWEQGSREEILALVTPELEAKLAALPESWLTALTTEIASQYSTGMARQPEAQLDQDKAVVKLPAKDGFLLVSIHRLDQNWLVDNIELIRRKAEDHPGSIQRQAAAIATVTSFLAAYQRQDRETLQKVTDSALFDGALAFADLSLAPLPDAENAPEDFDIRAFGSSLTVVLPAATELVRLDLSKPESEDSSSQPEFLVKDVILYDKTSQQQRNLTSVFTAPARARLFLKALQQSDLEMLSQISSSAFSQATWKRVNAECMPMLPVPELPTEGLRTTKSHTIGNRTDLELQSDDGRIVTCHMINENGRLRIEDVHFPGQTGQVTSLRTQIELLIPPVQFAVAWSQNDLESVRQNCSTEFNRLIWSNVSELPQNLAIRPAVLLSPENRTNVTNERATLTYGAGRQPQAVLMLVQERGYWVIDEIQILGSTGGLVDVRQTLRRQTARRLLSSRSSGVRPASYQNSGVSSPNSVQQAVYHSHSSEPVISHAAGSNMAMPNPAVLPSLNQPSRPETSLNAIPAGRTFNSPPPVDKSVPQLATADGYEVYGPKALQIASQMSSPAPATSGTAGQTGTGSGAKGNSRGSSGAMAEDGDYFYFGNNSPAGDSHSGHSRQAETGMTEPADRPISIQ